MPHSALSRAAATLVTLVSAALVGATLTAPTAVAADGGDRTSGDTSSRAASARPVPRPERARRQGRRRHDGAADLWLQRDNLSPADRAAYAKLAGRRSSRPRSPPATSGVHYDPAEINRPRSRHSRCATTRSPCRSTYAGAGYRRPMPDGALGGDAPDRHLRRHPAAGSLRLLHHRPGRSRPAPAGSTCGPTAWSTTTTPASRPTRRWRTSR